MTSPPSLRSFVLEHLLDDGARVPAVFGRDSTDVITPDRTLRDAALALLVLPGPDDRDLAARLLAALREFTDPDRPGFRELLDVTGAPHPVGDVRTPSAQALAAWAPHRAGTLLDDPALTAEAREHPASSGSRSGRAPTEVSPSLPAALRRPPTRGSSRFRHSTCSKGSSTAPGR
ncbi:hypothetical protein ACFW88_08335 [Streptomyces anandii]|uniref:Uncharacterized protein n=1 Tax=Streptomyces anandii TaxID=285454 RepID=A0ABW6H2B3_9ACTN